MLTLAATAYILAPFRFDRAPAFRYGGTLSWWSGRPDSNRRPRAPKARALTKLRYAPRLGCPSGLHGKTHDVAPDVKFTNLDKVLWPADGLTKGDLIEYYRAVSRSVLPHLRHRPLTVKRYPNGIEGETFFQKNAPKGTPEWVRTIRLHAESAKRDVDYILCNDLPTLLWLGNLGSIELHPWLSRTDRLERPHWLLLDVDPPEGHFRRAVRTALATRAVLSERGLDACVKTSGAK